MAENHCSTGDADQLGKAGAVVDSDGADVTGEDLDEGCAEFGENCEVDEGAFFHPSNQL